jgi:hypothetical protein
MMEEGYYDRPGRSKLLLRRLLQGKQANRRFSSLLEPPRLLGLR